MLSSRLYYFFFYFLFFYKGAYPEVARLSITQHTLTFVVGPCYLL